MLSFASAVTLALFATGTLGAPTTALHTVKKANGPRIDGSYIVKFKAGASRTPLVEQLAANVTIYSKQLLNGFSGKLSVDDLEKVRANADVELIEEDGVATTFATQTNAPWGLQRISQDAALASGSSVTALTYAYNYDEVTAPVNVYVIDTGIYIAHSQFGGRAKWGATFGGYADADGNGHGTHCAGTIGGSQYGVYKNANLFAVKVLSDGGSGAWSDVISGLNYALTQYQATGVPTVASLSLGGGVVTTVDDAVAALTAGGVHVVVAAGNSNTDAASTSPAHAPSAITVGASTITDARSSFSNYGAVVDIFAPGTSITSAWIGSTTATNNISGTSMATPHVAGLVAYLIAKSGNITPAAMSELIKSLSVKSVLTGIPSGTVNYLANNA